MVSVVPRVVVNCKLASAFDPAPAGHFNDQGTLHSTLARFEIWV
jgi:hypothetical protein